MKITKEKARKIMEGAVANENAVEEEVSYLKLGLPVIDKSYMTRFGGDDYLVHPGNAADLKVMVNPLLDKIKDEKASDFFNDFRALVDRYNREDKEKQIMGEPPPRRDYVPVEDYVPKKPDSVAHESVAIHAQVLEFVSERLKTATIKEIEFLSNNAAHIKTSKAFQDWQKKRK